MKDTKKIREDVREDYTRAVREPKKCCSSCCTPSPKGIAAEWAQYDRGELEGLPAGAVENSFGCGNPLAFSEVKPGQTVLDLGSGAGLDLLVAAAKVGPSGRVIGVDMTDAMIERARENIRKAGARNVEVRKGIIEELPVESGTVDWVISNCVINLSPEKSRVFSEIARVLKPGGGISVSDIVAEGLPAELTANRKVYSACIAGAIGEGAYLEGLRAAGLVDVGIRDRLVYDRTQLEAFLRSELRDPDEDRVLAGLAKKWAGSLVGKVASVRVVARKP